MSENKVGQPRKYKTPEDMQIAIDAYFDSCFTPDLKWNPDKQYYEPKKDSEGNTMLIQTKPFTITGLANALGLSRQGLLNYEEKDEYVDTIKRAKQRVEQYVEERLFDRDGVNGARFNLTNNFNNWSEKTENKVNNTGRIEIINDRPKDDNED